MNATSRVLLILTFLLLPALVAQAQQAAKNHPLPERPTPAGIKPESITVADPVAGQGAVASSIAAAPGWNVSGGEGLKSRGAEVESVSPTMRFKAKTDEPNVFFVFRLPTTGESKNVRVVVTTARRGELVADRSLTISGAQSSASVSFTISEPGAYEVMVADQRNEDAIYARATFVVTAPVSESPNCQQGTLSFFAGFSASEQPQGISDVFARETEVRFRFSSDEPMPVHSPVFLIHRIADDGSETYVDEITRQVHGTVKVLMTEAGFRFTEPGRYRVDVFDRAGHSGNVHTAGPGRIVAQAFLTIR